MMRCDAALLATPLWTAADTTTCAALSWVIAKGTDCTLTSHMQGYSEAENTWEPVEHIDNCPDKVRLLYVFEVHSQADSEKVVVSEGC